MKNMVVLLGGGCQRGPIAYFLSVGSNDLFKKHAPTYLHFQSFLDNVMARAVRALFRRF